MAMNQIFSGTLPRTITTAAPISAGDPYFLNGVLYVALTTAIGSGETISAFVDGGWTLPATALEAWTKGDALYWDPATGFLTNVAGALVRVGTAYADKSNGASYITGQCDLGIGA